jgi:hypothetical protein
MSTNKITDEFVIPTRADAIEMRRMLQDIQQIRNERGSGRYKSNVPFEDFGSNFYFGKVATANGIGKSSASIPTVGQITILRIDVPVGSSPLSTLSRRITTPTTEANVEKKIWAYNVNPAITFKFAQLVWVVRLANGAFVVLPLTNDGSGTGGGCCDCISIRSGDINVDGVETTSVWNVKLSAINYRQLFGTVTIKEGEYSLIWSPSDGYWKHEFIAGSMAATFLSGENAEDYVTLGGDNGSGSGSGSDGLPDITAVAILRRNDSGYTTLKITIDGDVPDELTLGSS